MFKKTKKCRVCTKQSNTNAYYPNRLSKILVDINTNKSNKWQKMPYLNEECARVEIDRYLGEYVEYEGERGQIDLDSGASEPLAHVLGQSAHPAGDEHGQKHPSEKLK